MLLNLRLSVDSIPSALTNIFNDLPLIKSARKHSGAVLKRRDLAHMVSSGPARLRHSRESSRNKRSTYILILSSFCCCYSTDIVFDPCEQLFGTASASPNASLPQDRQGLKIFSCQRACSGSP